MDAYHEVGYTFLKHWRAALNVHITHNLLSLHTVYGGILSLLLVFSLFGDSFLRRYLVISVKIGTRNRQYPGKSFEIFGQ